MNDFFGWIMHHVWGVIGEMLLELDELLAKAEDWMDRHEPKR